MSVHFASRSFRLRTIVFSIVVLVLLVLSAAASTAANPFQAGQPSTRSMPIDGSTAGVAIARATAIGRALGLPDGARSVERYDDRFDRQVYDEVTVSDVRGRPIAIERLDEHGRLLLAVSLGWKNSSDAGLAQNDVATRARLVAKSAGFDPSGPPDLRRSRSAGGWLAMWNRTEGGVPVRGDGLRVTLWADGSLHSVSRSEHQLAARPGQTLPESQVGSIAASFLARYFGAAHRAQMNVAPPALSWIAPNDTFDAARPDAPAGTLRLAWIVTARASGDLAQRLNAIEIWIDAGDGSILGGDVAE
jgi:hypothetical protein